MDKKYQIFISSTYEDLKNERDQVIKAILEMGHIPLGMEMFSAGDEEQWQLIKRQIDDSDYYVVITAHRYGSVTDEGISYTEKEYDYACEQGVPTLGFIIDDKAQWPQNICDKSDKDIRALDNFKNKIRTKMMQSWSNKDDLYGKIAISLTKQFNLKPRKGWVRSDQITNPEIPNELARLSEENAFLRNQINELSALDNKEQSIKQSIKQLQSYSFEISTKDKKYSKPFNYVELFLKISKRLLEQDYSYRFNIYLSSEILGRNQSEELISTNDVKTWLCDLETFNLIDRVRISDDIRLVKWGITEHGRDILAYYRKIELSHPNPKSETVIET
ncbi:DUF4062 domain-containing protein [Planctomycetota bacterium]|nr:DUF4062 domain-containing protein [Planctomycetota bacterium]